MYIAKELRADKAGPHRAQYEMNKKKILKMESVCGICGRPVDKSLKYPDPMAGCVDHIIPIAKGGHPSALENLQLAHWCCNRQKSDKLFVMQEKKIPTNRNLPQSCDWKNYKAKD